MKTHLLLISLLLSLGLSAQTFNEILGRPTDNSITASVLFDSQVDTYIEYGAISGNYTATTAVVTSVTGQPVVTKISGLTAETRYYYRTRYRKTGTSTFLAGAEHSFITRRNRGSNFVFTIESDPHPYDPKGYHPLWEICLKNQLRDGADFMLDLGDTFGDDHLDKVTNQTRTSAQVRQLMLNNRPLLGEVCHSMPFLFCQGNHEGESGYYLLQTPPENLATYETIWRKYYYPNPEPDSFYSGNTEDEAFGMGRPQNYYAFEWGDALFVVVDGWRYSTANVKPRNWDWTIGKTQYDWLKRTLESSTATFKFVFTHHVMGETRGGIGVATGFEWGGLDNGNNKFAINRPDWELPIHQLMLNNKVNILFQGHDHVFARESLDKLIYQTLPMPSDSSYSLGYIANGSAFTGTVLPGSGHIRVSVTPDSVKVDYVSALLPKDETSEKKNGDVIYSYSIKKNVINGITNTVFSESPVVSVYANAAAGKMLLKKKGPKSIKSVSLFSPDAKLVSQQPVTASSKADETLTLKLNSTNTALEPGIYCILIIFDDNTTVRKLISIL